MKKSNNTIVGYLVNDVHISPKTAPLVIDIFDQLIALCKKTDVDWILLGGDVFTARSGQPLLCLMTWYRIVVKLNKNNIRLSLIPGNHDKTDEDSDDNYLSVYNFPGIRLHSRGEAEIASSKMVIGFVPYYESQSRWLEEYSRVNDRIEDMFQEGDIDSDAKTILITHTAVNGVRNNDGTEVEDGIKPSLFKDWTKVLVGHYHNASKVGENIYYTGSAYQGNYGETIPDKGFTAIYSDGSIKHIASKFPKYIKEVVDVNDAESLRNIVEKYGSTHDDYIRLEFHGRKDERHKVNFGELERMGFDCKYEAEEITEAMNVSVSEDLMNYDKKSLTKDFLHFCKDNNIRGEKLKFGLDLIKSINIER